MSVSSTSSAASNSLYSSIAARNKGMGGLVSGLDTESLVESLTYGTRAKISKQQQNRQLLVWKQAAYRNSATLLSEFQDKYFTNTTISKRMTSKSWYNLYKGTASSDAVKVSTTSSSMPGEITIDEVKQLATYATATSAVVDSKLLSKSFPDIVSDFGLGETFDGQTLKFYMDNNVSKIYEIDLTSLDTVLGTPGVTEEDFRIALENLITDEVGRKSTSGPDLPIVVVKIDNTDPLNPRFQIDSDLNKVTIASDCDVLGVKDGYSNRISTSSTLAQIFPDLVAAGNKGEDLIFSINGQTISAKSSESLSKVITRINNNTAAKVKIAYDEVHQNFTLVSTDPGGFVDLEFKDIQGNLLNQMFGIQGGSSFLTEAKKDTYTFGYEKKVESSVPMNLTVIPPDPQNLENLLSALASGGIGKIKLTINGKTEILDLSTDKSIDDFKYTALNGFMTAEQKKAMKEHLDPLLETHMNAWMAALTPPVTDYKDLSAADKILYNEEYTNTHRDLFVQEAFAIGNASEDFYIDLTNATVEEKYMEQLANQFANIFNAAVAEEFGYYNSSAKSLWAGLTYDATTQKFAIAAANEDTYVEFDSAAGGIDIFDSLGFTGGPLSNYDPATAATLADLGIETTGTQTVTLKFAGPPPSTHAYSYDDTFTVHSLKQFFNGAGLSFSVVDGVITIDGGDHKIELEDDGGEKGILHKLFNIPLDGTSAKFETAEATAAWTDIYEAGVNAEIVVNGQTMVSQSNNFTINGVGFEVTRVTDASDDPIVITVTPDATELVDKLQQWIDDYNALYAVLNGYVSEQKAKDSNGNATYTPLTDEQKADMTEKQIEDWETKAKQGILLGDPTLQRILNQLRRTIYEEVESCGIAPYEIGITTASIYNTNTGSVSYANSGQLELDTEKLTAAIEANGQLVVEMFTAEKDGLAVSMRDIIDAAVNTSSAPDEFEMSKRGTLITLAGTDQITGDNTSMLGKRIEAIDQQISRLKVRLEMEYNRYWKKFTSLETAIANLSSQSSWLYEQTS